MRTPATKPKRGASSPVLSARLGRWARIEAHASGAIVAVFDADAVTLGRFGANAAGFLHELRGGLPLSSLASGSQYNDKESRSSGSAACRQWPVGVSHRAAWKSRRGSDRRRAAGSRLLAEAAAVIRHRHSRALAVRLFAAPGKRDGAGVAARRRSHQDLRSEAC